MFLSRPQFQQLPELLSADMDPEGNKGKNGRVEIIVGNLIYTHVRLDKMKLIKR